MSLVRSTYHELTCATTDNPRHAALSVGIPAAARGVYQYRGPRGGRPRRPENIGIVGDGSVDAPMRFGTSARGFGPVLARNFASNFSAASWPRRNGAAAREIADSGPGPRAVQPAGGVTKILSSKI